MNSAFASLARDWRLILLCLALGLGCAVVYLVATPSSYTAMTKLAIDMRRDRTVPGSQTSDSALLDSSYVQTQVEMIRSERVLLAAIRSENLQDDPAFNAAPAELALTRWAKEQVSGLITALIGEETAPAEADRVRAAVLRLQNNLLVERAGLTSVIEIRYRGQAPDIAARVANAVARAYIEGEVDARRDAVRRAGSWLEDRINELRGQSSAAARAVQDFKTANNIVETPRGRLNEQQLAELNSQLILVRAQTAESKARLDRVEEVLAASVPEAVLSDVLRNDVITRLRNLYFDASHREAEVAKRLGRDHQAAVDARTIMVDLHRMMREEFQRVAEGVRSDYEIARTRQQALEAGVAASVQEAAVANDALLTLRELESSALSFKTIYDSFLRTYTETIQAQSYRFAEARVITEATPPPARSHPKRKIVLAVAGVLGLFAGLCVKLIRDQARNALHSPRDVQRSTGVAALGAVPRLRGRPEAAQVLLHALQDRTSAFAEGFRGVAVSLETARTQTSGRVLGIASAVPGEGATTFAANLASTLEAGAERVLLVDADLRGGDLTRGLGCDTLPGLADICAGSAGAGSESIVSLDGFDFLPRGAVPPDRTADDLLASSALPRFIEGLNGTYGTIVVDLPPVLSSVGARVAMRWIDACVIVIQAGRTNRDAVGEALEKLQSAGGCIAGCVLNKVESR